MKNQKEIRFEFGKNWSDYSNVIDKKAIFYAEQSLQRWIPMENLENKKFLDIGSGSGLFSLAAWNWGAEVYSFDYDENSVQCTQSLRDSMLKEKNDLVERRVWHVEQGDVLDNSYMEKFNGKYDVVYSWGVLHHTGNMKKALDAAGKCVTSGGYLFISIYNDQGLKSRIWKQIKKRYNLAGKMQRKLLLFLSSLYIFGFRETRSIYSTKGKKAIAGRGMNPWNDLIDWVGGYPFEYATPDEIISFYLRRGFKLVKFHALDETVDKYAHGCNEFVFEKR